MRSQLNADKHLLWEEDKKAIFLFTYLSTITNTVR